MKEAFDKIVEQLEEEREQSYADFDEYVNNYSPCLDSEYDDLFHRGLERAVKVIKDVAKEYSSDWIPVSERVPGSDKYILVSFENFSAPCVGRYEEDDKGGAFYIGDDDVTLLAQGMIVNAWMPLPPKPYKETIERTGEIQ